METLLRYYEVRIGIRGPRTLNNAHPTMIAVLSQDHPTHLALCAARNRAAAELVPEWGSSTSDFPYFGDERTARAVAVRAEELLTDEQRKRCDALLVGSIEPDRP